MFLTEGVPLWLWNCLPLQGVGRLLVPGGLPGLPETLLEKTKADPKCHPDARHGGIIMRFCPGGAVSVYGSRSCL